MSKLLIQAWTVHKLNNNYFLPYTHWVYLKEIVKYYNEVCLLSPILNNPQAANQGLLPISDIKGEIKVYNLPYSGSYVSSIRYFPAYVKAYKALSNYDSCYVRYPIPFGWLSKLFLKDKKRIIHFVGDPIDAARTNPNFSKLRKSLLIIFFMPEHLTYMWACKGADVYTNGHHLLERLQFYGVEGKALISSTLSESDFYFDESKEINKENLKLLYVGYLRKAKGIETIIKALKHVRIKYRNATLTIAGKGEFERGLKEIVNELDINNCVSFVGHIDKRNELNHLFRTHDVFCFASLSEGSPRVVLEAMANGLSVISTPVGSLPSIFHSGEELLFTGFNDEKGLYEKINRLVSNNELNYNLRNRAFDKVKNFSNETFIKNIFQ